MQKKKKKKWGPRYVIHTCAYGVSKGNIQIKIFLILLQKRVVGTHVLTDTYNVVPDKVFFNQKVFICLLFLIKHTALDLITAHTL